MNSINGAVIVMVSSLLFSFVKCYGAETDGVPEFRKSVSSFSRFPDQVDGSLTQLSQKFKDSWECRSADVFSWRGGPELAVCGSLVPTSYQKGAYSIGPSDDFSWIVDREKKGKVRLLWVGGGAYANDEFLKPEGDRKFVIIVALRDGRRYDSMFETPIVCGRDACEVGRERCAVDVPKDVYPDVVKRVKAETHRTFASLPEGAYELLVGDYSHELLTRALTGDLQAADLLLHFPFALDGALGEQVAADQETYQKVQRLGCLGAP